MKTNLINLLVVILASLFIIFPIAQFCYAGTTTTTPSTTTGSDKYGLGDVKSSGLVTKDATEVVGSIIQTIIGIVGVILVVVLIYGGVLYMTSGGSEEKTKTAKKAITYGIVGITIIALAFAVTRFVLDALIKQ